MGRFETRVIDQNIWYVTEVLPGNGPTVLIPMYGEGGHVVAEPEFFESNIVYSYGVQEPAVAGGGLVGFGFELSTNGGACVFDTPGKWWFRWVEDNLGAGTNTYPLLLRHDCTDATVRRYTDPPAGGQWFPFGDVTADNVTGDLLRAPRALRTGLVIYCTSAVDAEVVLYGEPDPAINKGFRLSNKGSATLAGPTNHRGAVSFIAKGGASCTLQGMEARLAL